MEETFPITDFDLPSDDESPPNNDEDDDTDSNTPKKQKINHTVTKEQTPPISNDRSPNIQAIFRAEDNSADPFFDLSPILHIPEDFLTAVDISDISQVYYFL